MPGLIVAEWIERSGGAEKVLDRLAEAFPDARIRALWNDAAGRFDPDPGETWLARTPLRRHKALALPFMLPTWRALAPEPDLDWILSSVHLFAHHARVRGARPDLPRLAYVHSPARYIWAPETDPRGSGAAVRLASPALRRVDRARARELTGIAANSAFVAERIERSWGRASTVIPPPVDVAQLSAVTDWRSALRGEDARIRSALPSEYVLGASRFVGYKRLDFVIRAAERAGLPAVIAGSGPDERALRAQAESATVPVVLLVAPSDALLRSVLQDALAFVFPSVEDFGILPVEAQALSTPVVTGPVGGQTEAVVPGVTGTIAPSTGPDDLAEAIRASAELPGFDGARFARRFGGDRFVREVRQFVGTWTGGT